MRRLIVPLILALVLGACHYTGPTLFGSAAGYTAWATTGIHHDPTDYDDILLPYAGAHTVVKDSAGNPVVATTGSSVSVIYYTEDEDGFPVLWDCGTSHATDTTQAGFTHVQQNNTCHLFISGPGYNRFFVLEGYYAGVSFQNAYLAGNYVTTGGYPHASPWEFVDVCPATPPCEHDAPEFFGAFTEAEVSTPESVLAAVDYTLLVPGPETDFSDPSTAVGVTDLTP